MTGNALFEILKEFVRSEPLASGACIVVNGTEVRGFIASKGAEFDWDLSDKIAGLDSALMSREIVLGGDGMVHSYPEDLFPDLVEDYRKGGGPGSMFLLKGKDAEWVEHPVKPYGQNVHPPGSKVRRGTHKVLRTKNGRTSFAEVTVELVEGKIGGWIHAMPDKDGRHLQYTWVRAANEAVLEVIRERLDTISAYVWVEGTEVDTTQRIITEAATFAVKKAFEALSDESLA